MGHLWVLRSMASFLNKATLSAGDSDRLVHSKMSNAVRSVMMVFYLISVSYIDSAPRDLDEKRGPATHMEVQRWAECIVSKFDANDMDHLHKLDLTVTLRWGGVGGMLSALFYIRDALASILKVEVTVTFHRKSCWSNN